MKPGTNIASMCLVTIVVVSRLAYRKGIDLLVAAAPRVCEMFPEVRFVIGVYSSQLQPAPVLNMLQAVMGQSL
jgi:hypothetical protein